MKTLIFSDTHLSTAFDPVFFDQLVEMIQGADQVIINGDFWDAYLTTFDEFVNSQWQQLFPILKSKNTFYIYGNHDLAEFSDERVSLFSVSQQEYFGFKSGGVAFHVEHGHRLQAPLSSYVPLLSQQQKRMVNRLALQLPIVKELYRFVEHFWDLLDHIKIQKHIKKARHNSNYDYFIFGHTHIPVHNRELGYANPGVCQKNIIRFLKIDEGSVELVERWYG